MSDVLELIGAAVNVTKSVNFVEKSAKNRQKIG
jgi:hypothetical protein